MFDRYEPFQTCIDDMGSTIRCEEHNVGSKANVIVDMLDDRRRHVQNSTKQAPRLTNRSCGSAGVVCIVAAC